MQFLSVLNKKNPQLQKKIGDSQNYFLLFYRRRLNKIPAATAEPITPDTLGAMACINK
jgi:hypothetical protein